MKALDVAQNKKNPDTYRLFILFNCNEFQNSQSAVL
jgi:hypothetical protein